MSKWLHPLVTRSGVGHLIVVCCALVADVGLARADSLEQAADRYRPYMVEQIDQSLAGARALRDQLSAKDIAAEAMRIASEICIYTNDTFSVEEL